MNKCTISLDVHLHHRFSLAMAFIKKLSKSISNVKLHFFLQNGVKVKME